MDEQQAVLTGGGVLTFIVTLWKLVFPYLGEKLGVGSRETKLLENIKSNQSKILSELSKMVQRDEIVEAERRHHYKLLETCNSRLERLERSHHADSD